MLANNGLSVGPPPRFFFSYAYGPAFEELISLRQPDWFLNVKIYFFKTGCVYHGIGNAFYTQTAVKIAKKTILKYALLYTEDLMV